MKTSYEIRIILERKRAEIANMQLMYSTLVNQLHMFDAQQHQKTLTMLERKIERIADDIVEMEIKLDSWRNYEKRV